MTVNFFDLRVDPADRVRFQADIALSWVFPDDEQVLAKWDVVIDVRLQADKFLDTRG